MYKRIISILMIALLMTSTISVSYANKGEYYVNFNLDKEIFYTGEYITGKGIVMHESKGAKNTDISVVVEDITGLSLYKIDQYTTQENGEFFIKFKLPLTLKPDSYVIKVKAFNNMEEKTFKLINKENPEEPKEPEKPTPSTSEAENKVEKINISKIPYKKEIDCGWLTISKNEIGKTVALIEVKKEKIEKQISNKSTEKLVIRGDIKEEVDEIIVRIESNFISHISENKKELEFIINELLLKIEASVLDVKDSYFIELRINKDNEIFSKEFTQFSKVYGMKFVSIKGNKVNDINIENPIYMSIKYDLNKDSNFEKIGLYMEDSTEEFKFVGGKIDRDGRIGKEIKIPGKYVVLQYDKKFKDVDIGWANNAIEVLVSRDIINGVDSMNFKPNNTITRGEFCKILVKALDLKPVNSNIIFKDIVDNQMYSEDIKVLEGLNIVDGHNGRFRPNNEITREEMVVIIVRALNHIGYEKDNIDKDLKFIDKDNISSWAKEAVSIANSTGIVEGKNKKEFAPKDKANRAETAVMVYRLLKISNFF